MVELRPFRSEAEYDAATQEIQRLWNAEPRTPDGDRLDVLVLLTADYEERHYPPIDIDIDPIEVIRIVMRDDGRSQSDLAKVLGSRARASEILSGKRGLSLDMVRALSEEWRIPVELLVGKRRASAA